MWFVASVARRSISNVTEVPREMVLVVTHIISQLLIFCNGSPISLLFPILNFWQQLPWPATVINTSGVTLAIMVMVHDYFTVSMAISSGNRIKSIQIMLDLLIRLQLKLFIAPTSDPQANSLCKNNRGLVVTVRTLIIYFWVIFRYFNESWRELILWFCYLFTILWCRCGPRSWLRGTVLLTLSQNPGFVSLS